MKDIIHIMQKDGGIRGRGTGRFLPVCLKSDREDVERNLFDKNICALKENKLGKAWRKCQNFIQNVQ